MALQLPTNYAMACVSLARGGRCDVDSPAALLIRYPMYSSLIENEEGRRVSGMYSMTGDVPEQVNAHAATLWELCLLRSHYDPTVAAFAREMEEAKSLRMDQKWREVLKRDYSHKIFTASRLTKKREMDEEMDEEDIDNLIDHAFESDEE